MNPDSSRRNFLKSSAVAIAATVGGLTTVARAGEPGKTALDSKGRPRRSGSQSPGASQLREQESLDLLLQTLENGSAIEQAEAARLLGEAAIPEAVQPLLEYVEHSLQYHKAAGFTALGRIGDASVCDRIYPLIDDPRMRDDFYWFGLRSMRAAACHALLMLGDPRGAPFLDRLADEQQNVFYAWFASAILQLEGDLPEIARLKARLTVDALFHPSAPGTRYTDPSRLAPVVGALGLIGGQAAAAKAAEFLDHSSRYVRGAAALSVVRAGGRRDAVEELSRRDETGFVKAKAALALGDVVALVILSKSAQDSFERAVAIECLGMIGKPENAATVAGALKDPDAYVRLCALEALERLDAQQAGDAAHKLFQDPASGVRCQAAKTLIVLERSA